ncbi:MAG: serine/threonine protein kinase [Candidatus Vogelbacteria bacterium]|nr:serine/threonine protein kinase [Candidatus Vogelbacteria bacterium]
MSKKESKDSLVGKVIGGYKVVKLIAEGGFGKTYKVKEIETGAIDCLKDCSNVKKEYAFVLKEEYKTARKLRHHCLPSMRALVPTSDGKYALIMSYIDGKTLEQWVEKFGKLDPEHVAWITERTLHVLKYMHYHGVVHGDIKPQNIIIVPKEHQIVLIDFGLAMVKPKSGDENMGWTKEYAPPEQLDGKVLVPESDLYSLGKTMIYALSGNQEAVAKLQVPDEVPGPMCDFVYKLIVRDVNNRPNWEEYKNGKKQEDLTKVIVEVRKASFGRTASGMKPLPAWLDEEDKEE